MSPEGLSVAQRRRRKYNFYNDSKVFDVSEKPRISIMDFMENVQKAVFMVDMSLAVHACRSFYAEGEIPSRLRPLIRITGC